MSRPRQLRAERAPSVKERILTAAIEEFAADFPDDPEGTRRQYIDDYIRKANPNERLRIIKTVVLTLSLALTVIPLLIATAARNARV